MSGIDPLLDGVDWEPIPGADKHEDGSGLAYATHRGVLRFGDDIEFECFVLNTGQRVFSSEGIERWLAQGGEPVGDSGD